MPDSVKWAIKYLEEMEGFSCGEILGKGAFGSVVKVVSSDAREMAAKIIQERVINILEVDEWPRLQHQNVLRLLGTVRNVRGVVIFLMDLMPTSLFRRIQDADFRRRPDALDLCRSYARDALTGLVYLHQLGLCHLDFRAENILLSKADRAIVADFSGLSWEYDLKDYCPLPKPLRPPEMLPKNKRVWPMPIDRWSCGLLLVNLFMVKGYYTWALRNARAGHIEAIKEYRRVFQCKAYVVELVSDAYYRSSLSSDFVAELISLVGGFLQMDPRRRSSPSDGLNHKFLAPDSMNIQQTDTLPGSSTLKTEASQGSQEDSTHLSLPVTQREESRSLGGNDLNDRKSKGMGRSGKNKPKLWIMNKITASSSHLVRALKFVHKKTKRKAKSKSEIVTQQ